MNSVGSLAVSATYVRGALTGLEARLERPSAARIFIGQGPEAVIRTVPYLYTLCAQAQGAAARAALAAAEGKEPPPADSAALWAEALHEHFWRLLLDWPLALGLPQAKEAFITWRTARSGSKLGLSTLALLESTLLGCSVDAWQKGRRPAHALAARCLAQLESAETPEVFDFPPLNPADWLAYWRDGHDREPAVTPPASVATAWQGRLQGAIQAAVALVAGQPYPVTAAGDGGWGIGQAQTARGVLTHGVRIEDGRVVVYRVWAPTDRHFADARYLEALLQGGIWPDVEAAKRAVEQAVLALDPCLPYTVKVDNA